MHVTVLSLVLQGGHSIIASVLQMGVEWMKSNGLPKFYEYTVVVGPQNGTILVNTSLFCYNNSLPYDRSVF